MDLHRTIYSSCSCLVVVRQSEEKSEKRSFASTEFASSDDGWITSSFGGVWIDADRVLTLSSITYDSDHELSVIYRDDSNGKTICSARAQVEHMELISSELRGPLTNLLYSCSSVGSSDLLNYSSTYLAALRVADVHTEHSNVLDDLNVPSASSFEKFSGLNVSLVCSPFGLISPQIFHSLLYEGVITLADRDSAPIQVVDSIVGEFPGALPCPVFHREFFLGMILTFPLKISQVPQICLLLTSDFLVNLIYKAAVPLSLKESIPFPVAYLPPIERVLDSVLCVEFSDIWASSILLSRASGLLLTNKHVVQGSPGKGLVRLRNIHSRGQSDFIWKPVDVEWMSPTHWDLAFLRIRDISSIPEHQIPNGVLDFDSSPLDSANEDAKEGDMVFCIGFALFNPRIGSRSLPMVTRGTITRIIHHPNAPHHPVAIMTSAAIHRGSSGGFLLHASTGKLIAITTSNLKTTTQSSTQLFPHINFSIPISVLKDPSLLQSSETDSFAADTWALRPESSQSVEPPPPLKLESKL